MISFAKGIRKGIPHTEVAASSPPHRSQWQSVDRHRYQCAEMHAPSAVLFLVAVLPYTYLDLAIGLSSGNTEASPDPGPLIRCFADNRTLLDPETCHRCTEECDNTVSCEAVLGIGLQLDCSMVCRPDLVTGGNIKWTTPQKIVLHTGSAALTLNSSQTAEAEGCFSCSCTSNGQFYERGFSVTVNNGSQPAVSGDKNVEVCYLNDTCYLKPQSSLLNMTSGDLTCVNVSVKGYPTPTYDWYFYTSLNQAGTFLKTDTNPCFLNPSTESMCIMPAIFEHFSVKKKSDVTIEAKVSNLIGHINLLQNISTQVDYSWYLNSHLIQSSGDIYADVGSVAVAYCAVFADDYSSVNFSLCDYDHRHSAYEQGCLFASNDLSNCHSCGYKSTTLDLTDIPASGGRNAATKCKIATTRRGNFVCIASRLKQTTSQVIGSFTIRDSTVWMKWHIGIISAAAGAAGLTIGALLVITCTVLIVRRKRHRNRNNYERLRSENNRCDRHCDNSDHGQSASRSSNTGDDLLDTYPPVGASERSHTSENIVINRGSDSGYTSGLKGMPGEMKEYQRPHSRNSAAVARTAEIYNASSSQESQPSVGLQTHEEMLEKTCWMPFGFQTHKVAQSNSTEMLYLVPGTEEIYLEVPGGAVMVPSLEVRTAVIACGPMFFPGILQLASMVVYVDFKAESVSSSLILHLPDWRRKDGTTGSRRTVIRAEHDYDHSLGGYQFKVLPSLSGMRPGSDSIPLSGHCSLYAIALGERESLTYYLAVYQSEEENKTKVQVVVTFKSVTWLEIVKRDYLPNLDVNYKRIGQPYPFAFQKEQKDPFLEVRWETEGARELGWQAVICDVSRSEHKIYRKDVSIQDYLVPDSGSNATISQSKSRLKTSVRNGTYPPGKSCEITFPKCLRDGGEPVRVPLVFSGDIDGGPFSFPCQTFQIIARAPDMTPEPPEPPAFTEMKRLQPCFVENVHIDDNLLAILMSKDLLTRQQFQKIFQLVSSSTPPTEIASYLIYLVLSWSSETFENQLGQLADALVEHDDKNNLMVGQKVHAILRCNLDSPQPFSPASSNTSPTLSLFSSI